jgi:hypothetical protein
MSGCSTQTMTTKTLSSLTIAAVLAGSAFASVQVADPPLASAWDCSAVSVTSAPAISGGAGLLLAPTAKRFVASSGSLRLAPGAIVRITP